MGAFVQVYKLRLLSINFLPKRLTFLLNGYIMQSKEQTKAKQKGCEFMKKAKVLLLPSVCYENCPLSILEAHALGVPVVTMNSGGMAELVKDGVTGSLVQAPTAESVAETIVKTLGNDEYYSFLKKNCENEGENIADVESYCEDLIGKYKELINRR